MLHAWYTGHTQPSLPYLPNVSWHGHLFQWGILVAILSLKMLDLNSDLTLI
jgi:uncharacterized protein involved in response to NO